MLPQSVHDVVLGTMGVEARYGDTVEKVKAYVSNKVSMSGPTPMDIGYVFAPQPDDNEEVGAVSMSLQCHGRGGWGHLQKDCPAISCKGSLKGTDKGKGPEKNGTGQVWSKVDGKGSKGRGSLNDRDTGLQNAGLEWRALLWRIWRMTTMRRRGTISGASCRSGQSMPTRSRSNPASETLPDLLGPGMLVWQSLLLLMRFLPSAP